MDQSETINTHLHKVLTHRNYIHNVSLQKQLNIYDKQKKLVERELLQIHKVREAIQQINKSLPQKSQRFKNRDDTAKKRSKYDSLLVIKSEKTVQDREERLREHGVAADGGIKKRENGPIKVNEEKLFGLKDKNITDSSRQTFQEKVEKDCATGVVLRKEERHEATFSNAMSESRCNIEPIMQNGIRITIDLKSNTVPVDNQTSEKRAVITPPETGNPSNGNDRKMTTEKYDKNITSQLTGNEKLFTRRPPYMKSCSAPSLPVQKLEEAVECEEDLNGPCEIYRLPKTPMVNKDRYTNYDEDLYRKSLLANHAGTKLPALTNNGVPDGNANKINTSNFVNNAQCLEGERNQSSIVFGTSPHNDACSLMQSRPRSKTWQHMETLKPKAAWNSPKRQRKHKESPLSFSTFSNNDVCVIDRSRKRATTVCNVDNTYPEYRRFRSKTDTCNIIPCSQQRSARDSNWIFGNPRPRSVTVTGANETWTKTGVSKNSPETEYYKSKSQSCESVQKLSEDEAIAIKGKFRQIGHSVLATALMKKMIKKTA